MTPMTSLQQRVNMLYYLLGFSLEVREGPKVRFSTQDLTVQFLISDGKATLGSPCPSCKLSHCSLLLASANTSMRGAGCLK